VSPRLTLNLGLRWEINPPPVEAHGNDPYTVIGLDNLSTLKLAPQGAPLWETRYDNFAPRLGVAYQLSQTRGRETVLRGGFGVFFDTGHGQSAAGFDGFPFKRSGAPVPGITFPVSSTQLAPPQIDANPPVISNFFLADPKLKLPYTLQWNVTVARSLGASQTVTAAYVAALGRRLLVTRDLSLSGINPKFGSPIGITTNGSESDYHSLQLQFQRRLTNGVQALASYTWAHAIDTVSTDYRLNGSNLNSRLILRGNSDYDIRHNFAAALTYDLPKPRLN